MSSSRGAYYSQEANLYSTSLSGISLFRRHFSEYSRHSSDESSQETSAAEINQHVNLFRRHFSEYSTLSSEESPSDEVININGLELLSSEDSDTDDEIIAMFQEAGIKVSDDALDPLRGVDICNRERIITIIKSFFEKYEQLEDERFKKREQAEYENTQGIALLLSQVLIGMMRDYTWARLSYRNLDYFQGKLGSFWGENLTEAIGTFFPILCTMKVINQIYHTCSIENRRKWVKTLTVLALASWSSIILWNAAQMSGQAAFEWLGWSQTAAGYFSGLITGIVETIWQNAIVIPIFLNQTFEPLEIALNTLGGAVWQWVYQANLPVKLDSIEEIVAALEVAGAVAFSTLSMTGLARIVKHYCTKMQEEKRLERPASVELRETTELLASSSRLFQQVDASMMDTQPKSQHRYSYG